MGETTRGPAGQGKRGRGKRGGRGKGSGTQYYSPYSAQNKEEPCESAPGSSPNLLALRAPKRGSPRGNSTEIRNPTATRRVRSRPSRTSGRVTLYRYDQPRPVSLAMHQADRLETRGAAGRRTHESATSGHGVMRGDFGFVGGCGSCGRDKSR